MPSDTADFLLLFYDPWLNSVYKRSLTHCDALSRRWILKIHSFIHSFILAFPKDQGPESGRKSWVEKVNIGQANYHSGKCDQVRSWQLPNHTILSKSNLFLRQETKESRKRRAGKKRTVRRKKETKMAKGRRKGKTTRGNKRAVKRKECRKSNKSNRTNIKRVAVRASSVLTPTRLPIQLKYRLWLRLREKRNTSFFYIKTQKGFENVTNCIISHQILTFKL